MRMPDGKSAQLRGHSMGQGRRGVTSFCGDDLHRRLLHRQLEKGHALRQGTKTNQEKPLTLVLVRGHKTSSATFLILKKCCPFTGQALPPESKKHPWNVWISHKAALIMKKRVAMGRLALQKTISWRSNSRAFSSL